MNKKGFLIDSKGNVINNLNAKKVFAKKDVDESGDILPPFNVELFNFNPHLVRGHFDFDVNGKPIITGKNDEG